MSELALTNARVVLPDAVIEGSVLVRDGCIAAIDAGPVGHAIDLDGDYLLPGFVEIHTDNLEVNLKPRPGVRWPVAAAVMAHDAQVATAGITSVFDALAVGDVQRHGFRAQVLHDSIAAVTAAQLGGLTRVEHLLHLRCEVSAGDMMELFLKHAQNPLPRLVSVMDHTPGQRQWADLARFRERNRVLQSLDDAGLDQLVADRLESQQRYSGNNRRALFDYAAEHDLPLASHDDTTETDVEEAVAAGARISEFPTTELAANIARAHGMHIVMGAPNVILGGSHSGNVGASALARRRLLDILSSDYVPMSLVRSIWRLHQDIGMPLPEAVALVSANPADAVGLADRGGIVIGHRADLVRVRLTPDGPAVREVWRGGARIV
jgi:alpha-D-ribose 1-methylphosphonate 5-triphosphate diphosphatase